MIWNPIDIASELSSVSKLISPMPRMVKHHASHNCGRKRLLAVTESPATMENGAVEKVYPNTSMPERTGEAALQA